MAQTRMGVDNDLYRAIITLEIKNNGTKTRKDIVVGPYINKAAVKAGIKRAHRDYNWTWGHGNVNMIDFKWQKCRGWDATDER